MTTPKYDGRELALMRRLDQISSWFLVALGCVHNFVAAPLIYKTLTPQALWFIAGGLALWYAGFINVLRCRAVRTSRFALLLCACTNWSLLAFAIAYAALRGSWTAPETVTLVAAVATLTTFSTLGLRASDRHGEETV
jgi:hypothetical protein